MRPAILVLLALLTLAPAPAHAYLDGAGFDSPAIEGGGGGRLFSGAPRDGYDCSVCHRGGAPLSLTLDGIPPDGWEAGRTYDLTIAFPEGVRSVGAIVEIANERGEGAGVLDGLPLDETTAADLCRGGTLPAAHTVDVEGRTVARVDVCGASRAALRWTAPSTPVTSLRVFATVVAANDSGDPTGDSTGHITTSLRARNEPELEGGRLSAGCRAGRDDAGAIDVLLVALALCLTRALRRR
ncbi:MAG: hypothetical protein J0L92_19835 [Deltaproteobacteria bacterium]|nr:hypothetical protein [Deltaproteobacteria bacterium]